MSASCNGKCTANSYCYIICPAGVYGLQPNDSFLVTHQLQMLPDHVSLSGNREPTSHGGPPAVDDPHL